MNFADLESPLNAKPVFYCEPAGKPGPDPRLWPELERQRAFVAFMRKTQPHIEVHAIPNAGKRGFAAQRQAKAEGLKSGVLDLFIGWDVRLATKDAPTTCAWIDFKGFDKNGRPGKLSQSQIEWGNSMQAKGFPVACFYTVKAALAWLRELGAPIRGAVQ